MISYALDLTKDNVSLYLIPLGWVVAIAPRIWAQSTYSKATGGENLFRHLNPREFANMARDNQQLDRTTRLRIVRAESAQANGFENLGLFAAAVTAASLARVDPTVINSLTVSYLINRLIYNHIYIYNDLIPGIARTFTYLASTGMLLALFWKAGQELNASSAL